MKNLIVYISALFLLAGCSGGSTAQKSLEVYAQPPQPRVQEAPLAKKLRDVPEIDGRKITIAVYSFTDKTGQRKPADSIANLSSAVTQGSEVWVIKALSEAGNGTWFEVLERIGLENLVKERQLIRNTREVYEKELANGPTPLKPMKFAGLILEGGIIGYDSNVAVGGVGARYLGVGAQTEYRVDTVTVVMRIVSVSTGKVMLSVATEKTIASSRSGIDMFKFFDLGTKLVEAENGYSVNEPVNYAVRAAIEAGVVELINEGERKGLWKFKKPKTESKSERLGLNKTEVVPEKKPVKVAKVKPKIKVVPLIPRANPHSDKDVPKIAVLPKARPTLVERMCDPKIMEITMVCAKDTEELRKLMKVGVEKHVTYKWMMDVKNNAELYKVCNKNEICFKNAAEMYRWEAWTAWLAHVNKGKNYNLIK